MSVLQVLILLFQIKSESFLEDINNILNAGDVPNIYVFDDLEQIYSAMKPVVLNQGSQPTKTNLFSAYTKIVRNNLHTVITMRFVCVFVCMYVCLSACSSVFDFVVICVHVMV